MQGEPPAPPPVINFGGADRFLTYVSTDKPIYRPGEKLYVSRGVVESRTHVPGTDAAVAVVQVTGPKGDVVASGG